MPVTFFNNPVFQQLVLIVCKTLFHSLWLGMLLAILVAIVLAATRRANPSLRYNLLFLSLLVFLFSTVCLCYLAYREYNVVPRFVVGSGQGRQILWFSSMPLNDVSQVDVYKMLFLQYVDGFLRRYALAIFGVWLLIFLIKTFDAMRGFFYVSSLKKSSGLSVDPSWNAYLQRMTERLGLHRTVRLLRLPGITVPMVAGILRPVIFIPLGFFAELPANQIEAILLHELAHIKRRDYLINIVQIFCETIFFFNPAVLWVSGLIRDEREHCCDEMAISVSQNRMDFVQALVSYQEYQLENVGMSMAFPGKRNFLLDRIKRIIYKNNKTLNAMEKLFVTASLVFTMFLSVSFAQTKEADKPPVKNSSPKPAAKEESYSIGIINDDNSMSVYNVQEGRSSIQTTKNKKRFEIEEANGSIVSLKVDGLEIPKGQEERYKKEIDEIHAEIKVAHERAEVARVEAEKGRVEAEKARAEADIARQAAEKLRAEAGLAREQAEVARKEAEKARELAEQSRLLADAGRKNAEEARKQAALARIDVEKARAEAEVARKAAEVNRLKADEARKVAEEARKYAEVARQEAEKSRVAFEKMQSELIKDLIETGVITSTDGLSYKLNDTELIVNGKKQPDALHKKLKAKYVKESGWEAFYNFGPGTGVRTVK